MRLRYFFYYWEETLKFRLKYPVDNKEDGSLGNAISNSQIVVLFFYSLYYYYYHYHFRSVYFLKMSCYGISEYHGNILVLESALLISLVPFRDFPSLKALMNAYWESFLM